jgi:hypothetical protein
MHKKSQPRKARIYHIEAAEVYEVEYEEPIIGNQPVPFQDVEIQRINPKTGYILQDSYYMPINLN